MPGSSGTNLVTVWDGKQAEDIFYSVGITEFWITYLWGLLMRKRLGSFHISCLVPLIVLNLYLNSKNGKGRRMWDEASVETKGKVGQCSDVKPMVIFGMAEILCEGFFSAGVT